MTAPANPHTRVPKKNPDYLYCPRCDEEITDYVLRPATEVEVDAVKVQGRDVGVAECHFCHAELDVRMNWTVSLERRP